MTIYNSKCTACPLHLLAVTVCLGGEGPIPAPLMVVGMNPGSHEDATGRPFVGPAGVVLNECLATAGLARESIFITNAAKCASGRGQPTRSNTSTCAELYLTKEVEAVQPRFILAMGDSALLELTGESGIAVNRGKVLPLRARYNSTAKVIATYHPAAYLHAGKDERIKTAIIADLTSARGFLSGAQPEISVQEVEMLPDQPLGFDVETAKDGSLKVGTVASMGGSYVPFFELLEGIEILKHHSVPIVGWNLKFDIGLFPGIDFRRFDLHDGLLMLHLLDSGRKGRYGLEEAAIDEFGSAVDRTWLEAKRRVHKGEDISLEELTEYCAKDSMYALQLGMRFYSRLSEKPALMALYRRIAMPLDFLLATVERQPVPLDVGYIQSLDADLEKRMESLAIEMADMLGYASVPNFRSPKVLAAALYKKLGLPIIKVTKKTGSPSTDKVVLRTLRLRYQPPFVSKLIDLKRFTKYRTGYTRRWLKLMETK